MHMYVVPLLCSCIVVTVTMHMYYCDCYYAHVCCAVTMLMYVVPLLCSCITVTVTMHMHYCDRYYAHVCCDRYYAHVLL